MHDVALSVDRMRAEADAADAERDAIIAAAGVTLPESAEQRHARKMREIQERRRAKSSDDDGGDEG